MNDSKKDKPTENRIFTGSDKEFTSEQTNNLLKSPEFKEEQKNRIKAMVASQIDPSLEAEDRLKQMMQAIELIRPTKEGDLLADILKCRVFGYSHKKIAKTLMKSEIVGGEKRTFNSLGKAIKCVQIYEAEGYRRVQAALTKLNSNRIITP